MTHLETSVPAEVGAGRAAFVNWWPGDLRVARARQCMGVLQSGFKIGASVAPLVRVMSQKCWPPRAVGLAYLDSSATAPRHTPSLTLPCRGSRRLPSTYAAIKFKHVLYLPIAVIQAGGAFGFFLACGTVIRCDEKQQQLAAAHDYAPVGMQQLQQERRRVPWFDESDGQVKAE